MPLALPAGPPIRRAITHDESSSVRLVLTHSTSGYERGLMPVRHPLRATYRLQLRPGFTFDEAAAVVPYLAALGVSHVYTSPQLQATPGSTHGYDVVDHSRPSDDLGGEPARARLLAALDSAHMGQVVDIVPNHMAIGTEQNRWWWSLLRMTNRVIKRAAWSFRPSSSRTTISRINGIR